jgi:hypothetical protein
MISMDGSSFCVAGKRAFRILSTNSLRVIAINSIGDFVLFLGKVFVVVATVLIGIELIQVRRKKRASRLLVLSRRCPRSTLTFVGVGLLGGKRRRLLLRRELQT